MRALNATALFVSCVLGLGGANALAQSGSEFRVFSGWCSPNNPVTSGAVTCKRTGFGT